MKELPKKPAKSIPNLRHIRAFGFLAEGKTLTATADEIGLSQPAVTQGLSNLEKYFDADLCLRQRNGTFLTDSGEILKKRVRRVFELLSEAISELPGLDRKERVRVERTITSSQLQALIAITEYSSFSAGARATGIAVPTIHRAARDLERVVGQTFFEQTSFGVRPTKIAARFAGKVQLAFSELDQARSEIATLQGTGTGNITVGAMPLARSHLAPQAISLFCRENRGYRVSIVEGPFETLLHDLKRGAIDFLIGAARRDLTAQGVVQTHLFDDPLSLLMRPEHPLAQVPDLTVDQLRKYPWVAPRIDSPLRQHFDAMFEEEGLNPPDDIVECNSLSASRVMLMDDDRLMLLSDAQARYELQTGLLLSRHLANREETERPIMLFTREDWHPTFAQQKLVDIIRRLALEEPQKETRPPGGGSREPQST
ncbi:LysR family transcriptional regulator [Emcibacter nanhaiensis]|uniref:LysR family transcriptional regulator n=1 Tax=Emcibacter nanhaiensis TaxID=1505037 RepID=A0A501PF37_9PROT|nr:LysR family transcriptional regulator [Emcibacter nanhaiensis]TPD59059.1 LysR family transcriptional regulator [Emcibacter nanhaiensis]